jgi:hypothetical protein
MAQSRVRIAAQTILRLFGDLVLCENSAEAGTRRSAYSTQSQKACDLR